MNVKALVHEPGLRKHGASRTRRDGEHFQIAGEDHIRAGENIGK